MSNELLTSFNRIKDLLLKSPERGRNTAITKVKLHDGLSCEIQDGPWKLISDMPHNFGGNQSGPEPGVYGRAALGSCMAITYAMWAAEKNIKLEEIRIEVQADFDSGAMFGVSDVPAGYNEVRCEVTIVSNASKEEVSKMLDEADAHSPYVDVFTRGQKLKRSLNFLSSQALQSQQIG